MRDRDAHNVVEVVEDEQIQLDTEVETYDVLTVGGEHVTTVVREVERAIEHVHTEAECGHSLVLYDSDDGSYICLNCDDLSTQSRWCHERCAIFMTEVIESVKLAERNGDIPVPADETPDLKE